MAAPPFSSEALLYGRRVAPRHRQTDQLRELRLDHRALNVREGLHVGDRVGDRHVGPADNDRQLHAVQFAWSELTAGPGPHVGQGPDSDQVLVADEHLDLDGAAMDRHLLGARLQVQ